MIINASDHLTLAAAIAAATAGDSIYLPNGTYGQCDLTGVTKLTIFGEGSNSVISFNTNSPVIMDGPSEITIKNCKISCTGNFDAVYASSVILIMEDVTIDHSGASKSAIYQENGGPASMVLKNVTITHANATDPAVFLDEGGLDWSDGVITTLAAGTSLWFNGGGTKSVVRGGAKAWTGCVVVIGDPVELYGVSFTTSVDALTIRSNNVTISGCTCVSTNTNGLVLDTSLGNLAYLVIVNNTISGIADYAILNDGTNNLISCVFAGNKLSAEPAIGEYVVNIQGTATDCVFVGNHVKDAGGVGDGLLDLPAGMGVIDTNVNSEGGLRLPGSVNNLSIETNGTDIVFKKAGSIIFTLAMNSLYINNSGSCFLKTNGVTTGSGAAALSCTHATVGWSYTTAAATAVDREHHKTETATLSSDGEMIHTWAAGNSTIKRFGVTAHGAQAEWLTNRTGSALTTGDVVVREGTDVRSVTKAASGGLENNIRGVWWSSSTADNASGWCVTSGPTKVKVETSTPADVWIESSATDGMAQAGFMAVFARTLEAESSNIAMANVMLGMQQSKRVQSTTISAAQQTLTFGDGNDMLLTSVSANVDYITTTGWEIGAVVKFWFYSTITPTFAHQTATPPAGTKAINTILGVNMTYTNPRVVVYKLGATYWEEQVVEY